MTPPHDMADQAEPIYEGKAKILFRKDDDETKLIQRFKDDATAFNGEKFAQFDGKGVLNCAISSHLFEALEAAGINTHFRGRINATDMLIERLDIVPLEVVVRNVAAGSLAERIGVEEGTPLDHPIVEYFYKKDELGDPMLADEHIRLLDLVGESDQQAIRHEALEVNEVLKPMFAQAGLTLVDFKMEFGFNAAGALMLGDELSPDVARIWDAEDGRHMDKDVFRRELADLIETYEEVAQRLDVDVQLVD